MRGVVPEAAGAGFRPVRILEVELSAPLPTIESCDGKYAAALVVVRLHATPLGMVEVSLRDGPVRAQELLAAINMVLQDAISEHLSHDGLGDATVSAAGIQSAATPACLVARETFLRAAPALSVVIPTRERPADLTRCVETIMASSYPPDLLEVVVVDNAPSTESTRNAVDALAARFGRVRYLVEQRPGSASARNCGIAHVDRELVVFTDDDAVVDAEWLTELARGFQMAEGVACVSGTLLPLELETEAQVLFEEYGGFGRGFESEVYDWASRERFGPLYPYAAGIFGTGNNMAFRLRDLRSLGGFDPALGNGTPALGGVDSEVLLRTIVRGRRIAYQPSAIVYHAHRPTYEGLKRQVYGYGAGLTAYLLKTLIAHPRLIPDFLMAVPRGIRFALDPKSPNNEHKSADYPRELTWLEMKGMLYGPVGYARSRRRYGPHRLPRHGNAAP